MLHETASPCCRWLLALLLAPSVAASQQIPAERDLFHVELLVFAYNTAPDRYYRFPGAPASEGAIDIADPDSQQGQQVTPADTAVRPVALSMLVGSHDVLQRLDRYQPLVHMAWQQTAEVFGTSPSVHVHGGTVIEQRSPAVDLFGTEQQDNGIEQVDGVVRLERGRFVHLAVDMVYRRPQSTAPRALVTADALHFDLDRPYQTHRILEKRQIRLGEIQYFDHAQFGILAVVERVLPEGQD